MLNNIKSILANVEGILEGSLVSIKMLVGVLELLRIKIEGLAILEDLLFSR